MAKRKRSLKEMISGDEAQSVIPQLVAQGGGGGFGYSALPGMPGIPLASSPGTGISTDGWQKVWDRLFGRDENARLAPGNWEDMGI